MTEIGAIRTLLTSKPRPQGWAERRARLDEVGSVWPVAADVKLAATDLGGVRAEWSIAPGSDDAHVLIYFHGGGYCSGSLRSHRRMISEAGRAAGIRTLAVDYRLAKTRHRRRAHCRRWRQRRRCADSGADQPFARSRRGATCMRVARIALDRFDDVRFDAGQQRRRRSAHP
jgi:alpha/beta hydrolase fold